MNDETLPNDLASNKCLALTRVVTDYSGMFTTKNIIELKDCNNKTIFKSLVGKSKNKEYKRAYHEAIRNAFRSIQSLKYNYIPKKEISSTSKKEIVIKEVLNKNIENKTKVLYAQKTTNGYQLVNTKPEIVFSILKSNVNDVYIIKDCNGILYKNNNVWIAEYYKENVKKVHRYQIKF